MSVHLSAIYQRRSEGSRGNEQIGNDDNKQENSHAYIQRGGWHFRGTGPVQEVEQGVGSRESDDLASEKTLTVSECGYSLNRRFS